jgi:hypothetical protein
MSETLTQSGREKCVTAIQKTFGHRFDPSEQEICLIFQDSPNRGLRNSKPEWTRACRRELGGKNLLTYRIWCRSIKRTMKVVSVEKMINTSDKVISIDKRLHLLSVPQNGAESELECRQLRSQESSPATDHQPDSQMANADSRLLGWFCGLLPFSTNLTQEMLPWTS